jgi:hypothetical protein
MRASLGSAPVIGRRRSRALNVNDVKGQPKSTRLTPRASVKCRYRRGAANENETLDGATVSPQALSFSQFHAAILAGGADGALTALTDGGGTEGYRESGA